jgi:hypothetical protein
MTVVGNRERLLVFCCNCYIKKPINPEHVTPQAVGIIGEKA